MLSAAISMSSTYTMTKTLPASTSSLVYSPASALDAVKPMLSSSSLSRLCHARGACFRPYSARCRRHTLPGAAARVARRLLHVHLLLLLAVEEGRLDVELVQLHVVVRHARQQRSQGGVLADWSEDLGEVDALQLPKALGHQACFVALHVSVHVALGLEHPLEGYGPHARRRLLQRPSVVGCQRRDLVVHGLLPVLRGVRRQHLRHGCRVAAASCRRLQRLLSGPPVSGRVPLPSGVPLRRRLVVDTVVARAVIGVAVCSGAVVLAAAPTAVAIHCDAHVLLGRHAGGPLGAALLLVPRRRRRRPPR